jgi:arylsulfatase A-like enzyme
MRRGLCGALLLLAAVCGGCGGEAPPAGLLLVTLDTTRADRLGAWGRTDSVTPNLDRLAREGVVFEQAVAPTPITLPSHASLLTGVYPSAHGVRDNSLFELGDEATLVSERLRSSGFRTGAFVGAYVLDARYGLDQGFEAYSGPDAGRRGEGGYAERPADRVVDAAAAWLAGVEPWERFFVWVHFFDPHRPFVPPPPWRERHADSYDGEIAFCDAQLGRLLDLVEARGRLAGLRVLVTADHGESLGEHGEESHGVFVYQSTLHVPLILWGEGIAAGAREAAPVSTVDVAATLLALAGVPARDGSGPPGRALLGADGRPAQRPAGALYVESLLPFHSFRWRALRGVLSGRHKLIDAGEPELYDLAADAGEQVNLAAADPERVTRLRAELRALEAEHAPRGWARRRSGDVDEAELLRALGYLRGSVGADPFADDLPTPRDRIADVELVSDARKLLERSERLLPLDPEERARVSPRKLRWANRNLLKARELLLELERRNPRDPHLLYDLGCVESMLGQHAEALPRLEAAVRLDPDNPRLRHLLALSYQGTGRLGDARREMAEARRLEPGNQAHARWLHTH